MIENQKQESPKQDNQRQGFDSQNQRRNPREFNKQPKRPGQHGATRQRKTEYGIKLQHKQSIKLSFGLRDKTLKNYFKKSQKKSGNPTENLALYLCSRLDAVITAAKICPTIQSAKQVISHCHVMINGETVNKRGYPLKIGDEISFRPSIRTFTAVKDSLQKRKVDHMVYICAENLEHITDVKLKIVAQPTLETGIIAKEKLKPIMELYSR